MKKNKYDNAIVIKNLIKDYGDFKLEGIDLTLPKGYIMGVVGENGAGKTTMIKAILGLITKDGGTIDIMGHEMTAESAGKLKEHIGVVLDDSGFPPELNLRDINAIMARCYKTWSEDRFFEYVEKFHLPEKKRIKAYSKGMKMKLSIGVAFSHESKLLILDEATSGLDPVIRDELLDILREFIQDEEKSVLISSHILSDLEKICDYITFVHRGKIVFCQQKDELLEEYGIIKGIEEDIKALPVEAVIACRNNKFSSEALVRRSMVTGFDIERISIEDIMLYYIKEERQ